MANITKEQYLEMYYFIKLNREIEDKLSFLYRQGKVVGGLYRSKGQEAISVGSAYALEPGDVVAPLIRNMGAVLVKGFTAREIFAQYMGKISSPTKGRDTTMHLGDLKRNVVAPISNLGPMIPIMAGVALSFKIRNENRVALTYIGDGGSSTGYFHEGVNMAAVFGVPFILIIENNQFAYSTPLSKQTHAKKLSDRAIGYGIEGITIDGNDIIKVYETVKWAREKVLREGPLLIECLTMRMGGHAEHDDAKYVPKELLEKWREMDPIDTYRRYLINNSVFSKEELDAVDEKIKKQISEALAQVEAEPYPKGQDELKDVYAP
jgi:TPP-dependent pyruvate/acetoin dehydrogenase alpha subunit